MRFAFTGFKLQNVMVIKPNSSQHKLQGARGGGGWGGTIRCSFCLLVHGPITVRAYKLGVGAYKQQLMIWKDGRIEGSPPFHCMSLGMQYPRGNLSVFERH